MYLGGFLYLTSTTDCQISTLIFELILLKEEGLYKYPIKKIPNGKVLAHLGLRSNVFPGPLADLSA
jgi:hypothetical protein